MKSSCVSVSLSHTHIAPNIAEKQSVNGLLKRERNLKVAPRFTTTFSETGFTALFCFRLTLLLVLALHLQVNGGQAELVGLLRGQIFGRLVVLLYGVADAEAAPHGGHLSIKLLPMILWSKPSQLNLIFTLKE